MDVFYIVFCRFNTFFPEPMMKFYCFTMYTTYFQFYFTSFIYLFEVF